MPVPRMGSHVCRGSGVVPTVLCCDANWLSHSSSREDLGVAQVGPPQFVLCGGLLVEDSVFSYVRFLIYGF